MRASTLSERRADYDALPLAWASQEVDPDTGLTHYHFREYSPSLGGWLTRDPIGLAGGYLNLRSYLGNRPSDALDAWGEERDAFSAGFSDAYHQRMSADSPVDSWMYKAGQAAGIAAATATSKEVYVQAGKNIAGMGKGVARAITDIPEDIEGIAQSIAAVASKITDPNTYLNTVRIIAALYSCKQDPCCWRKLMERIGELPSATLETAARKLKALGKLKQEDVFEMFGKEWGRLALTAGTAEIIEGATAARAGSTAMAVDTTESINATRTARLTGATAEGASETTANELTEAAKRAAETVGQGKGAAYGTRVHSAFEAEVKSLGNTNLTTEVSYLDGNVVKRGTPGSVRLDVVEGPLENPTAVYDLKTGSAKLTPKRIEQIQRHLPGDANTPILTIRPSGN